MEQLDFIRNGGETRRFHTVPVLRSQTVAEHSFHVTMLLFTLYGQSDPGISIPLLLAGLTHDLAEHIVGDLPAPAKRNMGERLELKGTQTFRSAWGDMENELLDGVGLAWEHELSVEQLRMLKVADAMEGMLYCVRERAMGNRLIVPCYMNFHSYVTELLSNATVEEAEHFAYVESQWSIYND